jgi:thiol-disulfide isomerase/thioredoxin
MYDELKDKGLELVAVNASDTEKQILDYVQEGKFTFKIVMGGETYQDTLAKAYGVQAYPTNYVVDENGKVLWRGVGFNEQAIRAALAKAGVQ